MDIPAQALKASTTTANNDQDNGVVLGAARATIWKASGMEGRWRMDGTANKALGAA